MKKIRILMAFGEPFAHGGEEMFAINVFKFINKDKVKMDFYTPYYFDNDDFDALLKVNNSTLFYDDYDCNSKLQKKYFVDGFKKFIKGHKNDYDIVHINSSSTFVLTHGAKIARKNGMKHIIVHSHATGIPSLKHHITNKLQSPYYKYADLYAACSIPAAEFRFSKDIIKNKKYKIINNGINLNLFQFDDKIRSKYRKKLNIEDDEILLGNVGRLSSEKNQIFLIDCLNLLRCSQDKYKLILVGSGAEKEKIINKINEYGLCDKVIMLENRNDVNNILMAIDIFVFSSVFEGFGIAALEAIATGLPVVCSHNIPINNELSKDLFKMNNYDCNEWVQKILSVNINNNRNGESINQLKKMNYDIRQTALVLEEIYENLVNGNYEGTKND